MNGGEGQPGWTNQEVGDVDASDAQQCHVMRLLHGRTLCLHTVSPAEGLHSWLNAVLSKF